MISNFLLNHLWQSTLFAAAAALLTLLFRKNHARVRYALWLAASIKFLIPFSLFIAIGSSIDFGRSQAASITSPAVNIVENISRPFNSEDPLRAIPTAAKPDWSHFIWMPAIAMWLVGCLMFLAFYLAKSRRIRALVRKASPIKCGRAFEVLQCLEQTTDCRFPIKLASSGSSMEPGVFGIFRPVLLLPEGMLERLSDSELEAILAHELAHIRRRDNLMSAVHMFIEALFWFHPMVWWIGAKLVEERERACDEEVLRMGKDPQAYAEGILKVCEFYLESPLACVAGVTGADMKKRIHAIMCQHIGSKVGWTKKLLLAGTGIAALALPITIGFLNAPSIKAQTQMLVASNPDAAYVPTMTFDVASVRESKKNPGGSFASGDFSPQNSSHIRLTNFPLKFLVPIWAYGVHLHEIEGIPKELEMIEFDVEAKSDSATDERLAKLTKEQVWLEHKHMFQALLAERFKMKAHWETRNGDTYELVVEKAGRLKSTGAPPSAEELKYLGDRTIPRLYKATVDFAQFSTASMLIGHGATIADIVQYLSALFGGPVVDKTGLTGKYDFNLKAYRTRLSEQGFDDPFPPLEKAILDELGLKLVPSHGPVQRLIIDHIEKPSEN
jgi:bla regulator protein blaR1